MTITQTPPEITFEPVPTPEVVEIALRLLTDFQPEPVITIE